MEEVIDFHATAGAPLKDESIVADEPSVIDAIKTVQDPEIMLDVYSLGLIYKIDVHKNGNVFIDMTLTSPSCPLAGEMPQMVANAVALVIGVGIVDVRLVWEPLWTLDCMSDEIKLALGI